MLDRVAIDGGHCDGGLPFVVYPMKAIVEEPVVQKAVDVVKSNFLAANENWQVKEEPEEAGELLYWHMSSYVAQQVGQIADWYRNEDLIYQHIPRHFDDSGFVFIRRIGRWSGSFNDFVALSEEWSGFTSVEEVVDGWY